MSRYVGNVVGHCFKERNVLWAIRVASFIATLINLVVQGTMTVFIFLNGPSFQITVVRLFFTFYAYSACHLCAISLNQGRNPVNPRRKVPYCPFTCNVVLIAITALVYVTSGFVQISRLPWLDFDEYLKMHVSIKSSLIYNDYTLLFHRTMVVFTMVVTMTVLVNFFLLINEYNEYVRDLDNLRSCVLNVYRGKVGAKIALKYRLLCCVRNFKLFTRFYSQNALFLCCCFESGIAFPVVHFVLEKKMSALGDLLLIITSYSTVLLYVLVRTSKKAADIQDEICHTLGQMVTWPVSRRSTTTTTSVRLHKYYKYKECLLSAKIKLDLGGMCVGDNAVLLTVFSGIFSVSVILYQLAPPLPDPESHAVTTGAPLIGPTDHLLN